MFSLTIFQRFCIITLTVITAFSTLSQVPLYADDSSKPLSSAEASSILSQRQNTAIDNAINTVAALPQTLFPGCFVDPATQKAARDKAKKDIEEGKKPTSPVGSNQVVTCIKDIVNIVFIVAIIWVIINIASSNLGLVLRSGEGSGEGPVANARKQIEKALIGLLLIGGTSLLLNLFASNLLNFNIQPLSQVTFKPVAFNYKLPDPEAPTDQAQYFANRAEGTNRTDIRIAKTDPTTKTDIQNVSTWVKKYFADQKVTSPVAAEKWVSYSRGSDAKVETPQIPLQFLVGYAQVTANWGGSPVSGNTKHECAQSKRNMFLVQMSENEQRQDTQLQQKQKKGTATECDYVKKYDSWEKSVQEFVQSYKSSGVSKKNDCAIFETLNKKDPNICPTVQAQIKKFNDFIQRQKPQAA